MKPLRKIIAASLIAATMMPLIASAHEGHDHEAEGAAKPAETTQQAKTTAAVMKDKETGQEVNTGIDPVLVAIGAGGLGVVGAVVIGGAYIAGNKRAAKIAKNKKK